MPDTPGTPPWSAPGEPVDYDALRQAAADRSRDEARQTALEVFASRVPTRFEGAATDRPDILAWARQYATDRRNCPSLMLHGPTGTGKTYLAYAAIRAVAETGTPSYSWRGSNVADLFAALRGRGFVEAEVELAKFCKVPLLMVDDLGAANLTDWTEEVTYRLVNRRYEDCSPAIFTTNTSPVDLAGVLGDRTASRLIEMTLRIKIDGDDRRLWRKS